MDIPEMKIAKVGTYIRDEKPSLVRVARALRGMLDDVIQGTGESPGIRNLLEYAAQNMIVENDSPHEPGSERKAIRTAESVTTCAHSCAQHAELMNISLWSGLPEELQELVFARLPWPQIYRLRILSKGWNQKLMSAKDSEFMRACVNAQPKLFALLAPGDLLGSFAVNMFDIASNRWHTFEISMEYDPKYGKILAVSASDGGLVCFISKVKTKSKKIPRHVFVCNPLTRVWKRLPPLYGLVQQKIMVQLIMDCETKHYRVIVVGYCKGPKVGNLVNVYHSETGQWIKDDGSSSGEVVYGLLYNVNDHAYFKSGSFPPVPCSYNFADGQVLEIDTNLPGSYAHESELVKDHLFRLKDLETGVRPRIPPGRAGGLPTHCIEEYQAENCGSSWTHLKDYPFNRLPMTPRRIQPDDMWWFTDILVCKDFLLLFVFNEKEDEKRREFLWLYEFSGNEWHELPMMPGGNHLFHAQKQMFELHFDSVP